jgi:hypothetical protein
MQLFFLTHTGNETEIDSQNVIFSSDEELEELSTIVGIKSNRGLPLEPVFQQYKPSFVQSTRKLTPRAMRIEAAKAQEKPEIPPPMDLNKTLDHQNGMKAEVVDGAGSPSDSKLKVFVGTWNMHGKVITILFCLSDTRKQQLLLTSNTALHERSKRTPSVHSSRRI